VSKTNNTKNQKYPKKINACQKIGRELKNCILRIKFRKNETAVHN